MEIRLQCEADALDVTLADEVITIGRAQGNLVRLSHAQVSGLHGQIFRRDGRVFFQDLGSTNGSLVRFRGEEHVVEGVGQREAELFDGAELLLGDRRNPALLRVSLVTPTAERDPARALAKTVVASRAFAEVAKLPSALLSEGSERGRMATLLELVATLQQEQEVAEVARQGVDGLFAGLPMAQVAGLFLQGARGVVPVQVRQREQTALLTVPWARVEPLFQEALARRAVVQIEDGRTLTARFELARGQLQSALAYPIVEGEAVCGLIVVAGPGRFSANDLDWFALASAHLSLALRNGRLLKRLQEANSSLREENSHLRHSVAAADAGERAILGKSPALSRVLRQVEMVARTDTSVLIQGETGTGKELIARLIHAASPRAQAFFAAVNCGALTESLLESELFGHVKGAFTGATRDKAGLFEMAHGGTLFLDEFGDVSPRLQVKLLRALENGEITPVGAGQVKVVDVRLVVASNKDLRAEVAAGRLREDLFYRVHVFPVALPPLRERSGDVEVLARAFLGRCAERFSKSLPGFSAEAMAKLNAYAWPGNVRELQNEVERAALMVEDGKLIGPDDLSERIGGAMDLPATLGPLHAAMEEIEGRYLQRALAAHAFNRTQTAKTLGISRQALTGKLHKYGLFDYRGDEE